MKTLNVEKMEKIEGGVSRGEYCGTLCCIIANNGYITAMGEAWAANCAAYYSCE